MFAPRSRIRLVRRTLALAVLLVPFGVATVGASSAFASATQTAPSTTTAATDTTLPSPPTQQSDTTTTETTEAKDDPAQDRLRYIIWGLVGLAVAVTVLTVLFWRATSPQRVVTVEELGPELPEPAEVGAGVIASPVPTARPALRPDPIMAPTAPLPVSPASGGAGDGAAAQ